MLGSVLAAPATGAPRRALRPRRLDVRAAAQTWGAIQAKLREAKLRSVAVTELAELQASGYRLLDVRPREDWEEFHIDGSVNVPLFGPVVVDSFSKLMKKALYAFNGMVGTDGTNYASSSYAD